MSTPDALAAALNFRAKHGHHRHHSACIHNLPPEEQVELRGRTVDWWLSAVGALPEQIMPDQWEVEPPNLAPAPSSPEGDDSAGGVR